MLAPIEISTTNESWNVRVKATLRAAVITLIRALYACFQSDFQSNEQRTTRVLQLARDK